MSRKRGKKPLCEIDGFIIGIDESNTGFSHKSKNPFHNGKSYMIHAGYLIDHFGHVNFNFKNEPSKGHAFNNRNCEQDNLGQARSFLESNPNFFYTITPESDLDREPFFIIRAKAACSIALRFFLDYGIDPKKTNIILDDINKYEQIKLAALGAKKGLNFLCSGDDSFARCVHEVMESIFGEYSIKTKHCSREYADQGISAVVKADRACFSLSVLNFLGNEKKWSHSDRKVDLNNSYKSALAVHSYE